METKKRKRAKELSWKAADIMGPMSVSACAIVHPGYHKSRLSEWKPDALDKNLIGIINSAPT